MVSNCWKVQLDSGNELGSLIAEAVQRGMSVIELRQGCLGEYESGAEFVPQVDRLAELARQFPGVQFNIALSLPCLSGSLMRADSMFLSGRSAAVALSTGRSPHLRLVDLQTQSEKCDESAVAHGLIELIEAMSEVDGMLSIEHARQPWPWFDAVMKSAWQQLGKRRSTLRLCFDPCNLLLTERVEDVVSIVESVLPDDVSMIHVKQRRGGQIQPDVGEGDLDWPMLLKTLRRRGHSAPVLFEVAPHDNVWTNVETATSRLFGSP